MPRTIWSGAISFGLVTVPINVVSATEDHSIRFHQYHLEDMGRVRTRKYCELEDREVTSAEIGKGYEVVRETKGHPAQIVPISDEDLSNLPLPTAKAIEIEAFVPAEDVDPIQIGEGYYLQASGQVAAKPYRLLVEALGRSEKVAIAKYAWSGRERLGMLRVRGDALVLHSMRWPDEIRNPAEVLPPETQVSEQEIEGALALMESMTVEDLEELDAHDEYTEAMAQIIEAKREHAPLPEAPEPEEPAQVLDLMAALNASVEKARESRGEHAREAEVHELAKPTRKTPAKKAAKKQPAKKTTAKKAATKKTSSRKPRTA
ncbi:Ku protein [Streptomyces sp. NPDC057413]|uniref:non-homologous end joining protein Ku n=1 Tax=Streptomyces sp. NPDC057413 TaxID=3346124 RepID=UPI0036B1FDB0